MQEKARESGYSETRRMAGNQAFYSLKSVYFVDCNNTPNNNTKFIKRHNAVRRLQKRLVGL